MVRIIIGCCGFPVSRKKYIEKLSSVEIQQTFYEIPSRETLRKWRSEVPSGFIFNIKAWQAITHPPSSPTWRKARTKIPEDKKDKYGFLRPTRENLEAWEKTLNAAKELSARFIIVQTPASFKCIGENIDNALKFFSTIDKAEFLVGWEPRGSWLSGECLNILEEIITRNNLVHVVDPFKHSPIVLTKALYFRLHGKNGEINYRYKYTMQDYSELASIILTYISRSDKIQEIHVMFNNVYMFDNAVEFKNYLGNLIAKKNLANIEIK